MPTEEDISFFLLFLPLLPLWGSMKLSDTDNQVVFFFFFNPAGREKKRLRSDNSLISLGKKKKKSDAPARRGWRLEGGSRRRCQKENKNSRSGAKQRRN